jgi:hypothetical protein
MKMCKGRFSAGVITILREAYARFGPSAMETFAQYECDICHKSGLLPKNYMGEWEPESHYPPSKRRVNPSGKSGYYKR